ncbi:hypothetical protein BpHYR1_041030 [Brachionus plicatilis]|uniref:Uncharacterized protein n=1 Tax=Brachionus plicatilis TaxID=10195 RepID=A0A3M7T141_BRAPC|nr:hypothetical protein BpHYR1_041030 [Brachionus plicatilis]
MRPIIQFYIQGAQCLQSKKHKFNAFKFFIVLVHCSVPQSHCCAVFYRFRSRSYIRLEYTNKNKNRIDII